MRTLKKTLCLVLVLAMMVGLCAMGASAAKISDYSDRDQITHPEAVATLSAINVLQGDDQGTFRPTATMNRAEGATFITKLLGTTGYGNSSFTDMGSYAWAQGAVNYCQANGIMAGYGDGTFGPQNPVTYVQWAKMLLCALGYDAVREGLTGSQWEINTIKLVNSINLAEDVLDFDWNAPITRDDAAQFALNTLKATMRTYDGWINVTTPDGTAVNIEGTSDPVENSGYNYDGVNDHEMQFVENYYPRLKLLAGGNGTGKYGEFTATWFNGDDRSDNVWTPIKTVSSEMTGTVIKTYTEGLARVTYGTIAADAGFILPTTVKVYENGEHTATVDITKASAQRLANFAGGEATLIKKGSEYRLIIKYPFLAQVTGITSAAESKTKNRQVVLKVWNNAAGVIGVNVDSENFAKKDIVLFYPTGAYDDTKAYTADDFNLPGAVKDVLAADSVTGNLTNRGYAAGALNSLTIDGVAYSLSANCFNKLPAGDPEINRPITAYVSNGYTMGYLGGDLTASNYVFVLGSATKSTALGGAGVIEVGYMKQDATTEVVDSTLAAEIPAGKVNLWYAMGKKGAKYTFTEATGAIKNVPGALLTTDGVALTATRPTIANGITTNDSTVFLIKHKSGTDTAISTYTGIRNVPTFKGTGTYNVQALVFDATKVTAAVYIDLSTVAPSGASSKPIFIVNANKTSETVNADGEILRGYSYINTETGKLDTVTAIGGDVVVPTVGLNTPVYDKNGYMADRAASTATDGVVIDKEAQGKDDVIFAGGVLTAKISGASKSFAVASDAVVYIFKGPATVIVGDPDDLVGRAGDLYAVQASATDSHLKTIYFVEA